MVSSVLSSVLVSSKNRDITRETLTNYNRRKKRLLLIYSLQIESTDKESE